MLSLLHMHELFFLLCVRMTIYLLLAMSCTYISIFIFYLFIHSSQRYTYDHIYMYYQLHNSLLLHFYTAYAYYAYTQSTTTLSYLHPVDRPCVASGQEIINTLHMKTTSTNKVRNYQYTKYHHMQIRHSSVLCNYIIAINPQPIIIIHTSTHHIHTITNTCLVFYTCMSYSFYCVFA